MNKRRIINIIITAVVVAVVLIVGVKWFGAYMKTDKCLDQGGCWNYELKSCCCAHIIDTTRITDYYWKSDYDTTLHKEFLKRGVLLDSISKSFNELIEVLNMRPSKSTIEFVDIDADTLIISVLNDTFLTQQMGSLGAQCYMAETVFTLTENDSVQFVRFEMDYGSHATPGVYSRKSYKDVLRKE